MHSLCDNIVEGLHRETALVEDLHRAAPLSSVSELHLFKAAGFLSISRLDYIL